MSSVTVGALKLAQYMCTCAQSLPDPMLVSGQGQSEAMVRVTAQLFDDIQSVVESKQLAPMLRTQASDRQHVPDLTPLSPDLGCCAVSARRDC